MGLQEEEHKEEKKEQQEQKNKKKESSLKATEEKDNPSLAKATAGKEQKKVQIKSTEQEESDWFEPQGELAVDVYQTDNEIIIQSTIAGVKAEELDISIENDTITISGERKNVIEDKGKNYFYQECFWGAFSRQIILPEEVDGERAEASMKDGVFTLRIPRIQQQKKVKKVKVRG